MPSGPFRVVGVSDSAYKVEEEDTRALVGHMILFMGSEPAASAALWTLRHDRLRVSKTNESM